MIPNAGGRRALTGARALLLCVGALLTVTACSSAKKPKLELACALEKCICRAESAGIFTNRKEGKEVLWRQNGDAYCPEGYTLSKVDDE